MKQEEFDERCSEVSRQILFLVLNSGRTYLQVTSKIDQQIGDFSKSLEKRH